MEELLHNYPNNHKKGDFNYVSSASSGAPIRVDNDLFAIGWLSKDYTNTNPNLLSFQLMRDALVIVYNLPNLENPDTPLNFNSETVKQLYLNHKRWDEVFPDQIKSYTPAKLFTRPNGSGTRDVFDNKVLSGETYYEANTVDSSSAMLNLEPGSIGYTSFADINQAKNMRVSSGYWNQKKATEDNIKNKLYELWRPFTGLLKKNYKYSAEIAGLLKWIYIENPPEVEAIFKKYGPRIDISDPVNNQLQEWLSGWA
ncbi:PstS family phosphate ABC transporter substrate-binding protein [Spiroplasma platyhelix]|uniref:PBP domain-containing protein n=1 Tax=Spiroplasma platyhelix PALS-1 TaxID=1276218 RepID=A0A846TPG5_9MOLU|nr:substrate-binding domain-containing protein [Spiroplasma platyhelix]NKE38170.1 hypothetical protein [Spiroplasma platyhelix PALS-1]